ncbi:MAG: hypothetical protein CVU65_01375 [Deltaproteobacteria bacterium HGW-Deltaproteobacteria-22]|nr:MAG: hypothetical protein CVU65_01375 [Deltaproteobacteria bacterium HGW-Deltaproteobacteria-22]
MRGSFRSCPCSNAMAATSRAWSSHEDKIAEGTARGSVTGPPRPVTKPVEKFFTDSRRISFEACAWGDASGSRRRMSSASAEAGANGGTPASA